jgi:hypothetical protein
VDAGKGDKVLERFVGWLRDVWGRTDLGSMLENTSRQNAEKWAVEYILYHIRKGKRGKTLNRLRNETALAFKNGGGNETIWKTVRVGQMIQSGLRNNNEERAHVKKQLALEKYPWNFGVMVEILKESGAFDRNFKEGMDAKEVEKMAHGLMLVLMFELGPRMSNITGENFKQKKLDLEEEPLDGEGNDEEDEDKEDPAMEMSHAMVWSDWEFEIICLDKHGEPLWAESGEYLTEWWIGGPLFYVEFKRRGKVWHVRVAKTRFITSKTSRRAQSSAAQMMTAELARRTVPEARVLDILCYWILWSGMPASKTAGDGLDHVFLRRAMGGSEGTQTKKLRVTDAVKMVKDMAHGRGVDRGHVAAKGLRHGFATAFYLCAQNDIEARERAVKGAKARGGNWEANSKVTEQVYLHTDDRGPLAMTTSWESGEAIGGGFDVWVKRQGAGRAVDGKGGAVKGKRK